MKMLLTKQSTFRLKEKREERGSRETLPAMLLHIRSLNTKKKGVEENGWKRGELPFQSDRKSYKDCREFFNDRRTLYLTGK